MPADQQTEDAPYQPLQKWEDLVDQRIREARAAGLFDNLPGQGKPLKLTANPFSGGLDIGFGLLKNAGFGPELIELDKQIRAELAALDAFRARAAEMVTEIGAGANDESSQAEKHQGLLQRWLHRKSAPPTEFPRQARAHVSMAERERLRTAYLDRA